MAADMQTQKCEHEPGAVVQLLVEIVWMQQRSHWLTIFGQTYGLAHFYHIVV